MSRRRLRHLPLLAVAALLAAPASALSAVGERARPGDAVAGRYIVVAEPNVPASDLARDEGDQPRAVLRRAANAYVADLSPGRVAALLRKKARGDAVADVIQDRVVGLAATATPWGLDRLDQRALPLNGAYRSAGDGAGVTAYVVDTGIEASHPAFGGRVAGGISTVGDASTVDCNGHGTHVAGTIGAAGYGVAPAVRLVPVRVMDCAGTGTLSGLLLGLDWMIADHAAGVPAVANLSLGTTEAPLLDAAVEKAVADGIVVAVAAGNSAADACGYSPARAPSALTVGATGQGDARAAFSNWGACLDLFAPGESIPSTWIGGATAFASGTSMASPHVAGAVAGLLTGGKVRPVAAVIAEIVADATTGVVGDPGTGSPNRLLHAGGAAAGEAPGGGEAGDGGSRLVDPVVPPAAPRILAARHRGPWIALRIRGPQGARYEVFRNGRLLLSTSRTRILVRHSDARVDRLRVRVVTEAGASRFSNAVVRTGRSVRVAGR